MQYSYNVIKFNLSCNDDVNVIIRVFSRTYFQNSRMLWAAWQKVNLYEQHIFSINIEYILRHNASILDEFNIKDQQKKWKAAPIIWCVSINWVHEDL